MIILAVLLLVIISLTFTAISYKPYSPERQYSEFEGFDPLSPEVLNSLPTRESFLNKKSEPVQSGNVTTKSAESPVSWVPSWLSNLANSKPDESSKPVKVEGFSQLLQPANYNSEQVVSQFSTLSGNSKCYNKSFSLSNSMGALCFDENGYKLLTTRGGNASAPSI
jgi:hypothetical protein